MDVEVDNNVKIINTCILVLLLLLSLIGNSLLIFTTAVATSRSRTTISVYILSMAALGLLECSLTMSLATGFSIEGAWVFGDFLMGFNCCFTQLQNIGVILTITAMSLDRYFIVCKSSGQHRPNIHKANYTVLYTWVHSFIISLPLLFYNESNLQIRAFVERSLCGLAEGATRAYIVTVIVTSICVPIVITGISFTAIFLKSAQKRKSLRSSNSLEYVNYCVRESDVSVQVRNTNYVLLLFIIFLIFKLPYLIVDISTQSQPALNNGTISDGLQGRFYHETALVWMMFCFSALFPLLTFAWFAEHKNRIRMYLCCGYQQAHKNKIKSKENPLKSGNVKDVRTNGRLATSHNWGSGEGRSSEERKWCNRIRSGCYSGMDTFTRNQSSENMNVPVLYATADGLHLLECASSSANVNRVVHVTEQKSLSSDDLSANTNGKNGTAAPESSTRDSYEVEHSSKPVSDRRIDVLQSNADLQSEGEYLRCGTSFSEDDTETELNTSANSMTLILPDFHTPSCPHSMSSLPRGRNRIPDPWGTAR